MVNVNNLKTPGVYIDEKRLFPPSVAAVETAIPAFVGYTQFARRREDGDLNMKPHRISSMVDYERFFGVAYKERGFTVKIDDSTSPPTEVATPTNRSNYLMYYCLQTFFDNGGGPCYIVSVDTYTEEGGIIDFQKLRDGLDKLEVIDEVTLLTFPDSTNLSVGADYYTLYGAAITQCVKLQDRFAVMDVWIDPNDPDEQINITAFRNGISGGVDELKYGAAYYPMLDTIIDFEVEETLTNVEFNGNTAVLKDLEEADNATYNRAKAIINRIEMRLPASPAVLGVYARVDNNRGVWKAPANETVRTVIRPAVDITKESQAGLNVDAKAGKSINAIRAFAGISPALIWGARTLAGNDNEWRYVSVRRYFNMAEESIKNATERFVFEPNDANTWTLVRGMISNFLTLQWRAGALAGPTPEQAFFVQVGLGETMTALDILEGRMIVKIGMAVVRPAEFIILEFSHKMQES